MATLVVTHDCRDALSPLYALDNQPLRRRAFEVAVCMAIALVPGIDACQTSTEDLEPAQYDDAFVLTDTICVSDAQ